MEEVIKIMPAGRFGFAREGYPFFLVSLALSILGWFLFWPSGILLSFGFLFCLYFFRDPERFPPADAKLLVSPADGKVLKVEELEDSPHYSEPHQKISIFMSALNVHVNRIPCDGEVKEIHYYPGKFFVASFDKASHHNERNAIVLETPENNRIVFIQIAGLVARRIVCYLKEGAQVRRGERYGMIRFGSRVEVLIPRGWKILVEKGDKVWGTKTALARMDG